MYIYIYTSHIQTSFQQVEQKLLEKSHQHNLLQFKRFEFQSLGRHFCNENVEVNTSDSSASIIDCTYGPPAGVARPNVMVATCKPKMLYKEVNNHDNETSSKDQAYLFT